MPGFAGYEVSNHGAVRSNSRVITDRNGVRKSHCARILKATRTRHGYLRVGLWGAMGEQKRPVHVLVLEAFVGPRPDGMETCHGNGDPSDNHLGNLRWDTHASNVRDTVRHGNHHHSIKDACPRGHLLVEPNLVPAQSRKGWRTCHSCALATYAASWAKREHGILWTEEQRAEYADRRYAAKGITAGAAA